MATNPRIEDLRKRIEKDPGSRLFAQLAEELRKDGELEDAIRVAREGLQKHPSYPSARMTLGRALLDTGDWAAARTEFELVLKTAADNILASRYLAECLENLGERDAAIARYKATLAMAPGEKHVVARLQELEKGTPAGGAPVPAAAKAATLPASPAPPLSGGLRAATARPAPPVAAAPMATSPAPAPAEPPSAAAPPPAPPPTPAAPPPTVAAAPLAPIPLSTVDGEMELETSGRGPEAPSATSTSAPSFAPIPLVAADEEFELEQAYEHPTRTVAGAQTPAVPAPPAAPAPMAPESAEDQEFELEAPHEAPSTGWAASIRPLPAEEALRQAAPPASLVPVGTASALISPTLGELYFNQGFTEKAIEVYRELSVREPGNERLSARLLELEKIERTLGGSGAEAATPEHRGEPAPAAPTPTAALTPTAADGSAAGRREQIERTIARLEGLLSAIRKG